MKLSWRTALLALPVWVLAAGVCAQNPSGTFFLVAKPGMPDPNFRETVVLVTEGERAQVTGVIVNRPTDRSLAELLPSERFKSFTDPIFFGGPVELQGLFAVFRADKLPGEALTMLPGLYLALHPNTIDVLLSSPPAKIRFFAGYSGWAPGQLRSELDRGDWLVVDADADAVFLKDTSRLWRDMVRRATGVRVDAAPPGAGLSLVDRPQGRVDRNRFRLTSSDR
jgi:putative transcriptional regulator